MHNIVLSLHSIGRIYIEVENELDFICFCMHSCLTQTVLILGILAFHVRIPVNLDPLQEGGLQLTP